MGNTTTQLNIEPGLFEWGGWFKTGPPSWMTPDELFNLSYPINKSYKPVLPVERFSVTESLIDNYERSILVAKKLCDEKHANLGIFHPHPLAITSITKFLSDAGYIIFVVFGVLLFLCSRQLLGHAVREQTEFFF